MFAPTKWTTAPWSKESNMSHSFVVVKVKAPHTLRCWNTPQVHWDDWRDVHHFVQGKVHFWQASHQDVEKETTTECKNRRSYEWSTASAVCVWFLWNQFLVMTAWWHLYSLTRNPPQERKDKLSSTSSLKRPDRRSQNRFCSLIRRKGWYTSWSEDVFGAKQ